MFHMEHCVFAAMLSNGKDWRDCGRPCDRHEVTLRDRTGANFPLAADTGCRNTVFNSVRPIGRRVHSADAIARRAAFPRRAACANGRGSGGLVEALTARDRRTGNGPQRLAAVAVINQLGVTRGTLKQA